MIKKLFAIIRSLLWRSRPIYYIGGADVLPPPLKGEEERDAIKRLEEGEESAKQLLIPKSAPTLILLRLPTLLRSLCSQTRR